jgi:citrate lyase subunit beta/citryl-CoA lyase
MFALRMAAAEAGVFAYDAAFANIQDTEAFRVEAEMARRLGFLGKSCIHPSQIAMANAVFRPGDEEIAHSMRVLEAAEAARAAGTGAFVVDGRMIDPPFFQRAEAIVATARRMGLVPR